MIYVYHKIDKKIKDTITITPIKFFWDMLTLIFKNVVYLEDYNPTDKNQVVLTFDDGYKIFLKYAFPILKFFKYPFELFLCSDFVNSSEYYLNEEDLINIVNSNGRLEYHSKNHTNLWDIYDEEILDKQIKCPDNLKKLDLKGFKYFAYPCWKYNDICLTIVKKYYKGARSGNGFAQKNNYYALDSLKKG